LANVLRNQNCVQFFAVEITRMSAPEQRTIDRAALKKLIAGSGVTVTFEDVESVARSLERIQEAASTLARSLPFDETTERFRRLLEAGAADGTGR
jgi:hypothetical protein